ncbi:hypothetical protein FD25_GL000979 [Levilactobacillus acidifarinae DSM 19394]|uniref:Accessory Sec system protein Asp3 n=1 Tax=Levilactobacillus acidifarinae DSM 19394 = JCM 15949 TaxID=1423715 RepID=A0A0R1LEC9_9LACO|nr:accessory Sec system protein Asp3 [Levilactobacillus acidifarinae]KRK94158.1 hypothetical protein FD25_GL000979 [Levilactobacillus acidifarinae DSM 19394]
MSLAYLLLWPRHLHSTYEYGCQVSMTPEHVVTFRAPLMPPGEVIHDWRSHRNYGLEHLTAELPILQPEMTYYLQGNITVTGGGVYLRLKFFDSEDTEITSTIIDGTAGSFEMPVDAVNYTLELVNTHHEQVIFRSLLLMDSATHEQQTLTVDQFTGAVQALTPDATAAHVTLEVREGATKPFALLPHCNNLVVFVTPRQLKDENWIKKITQERHTFLAHQPPTDPVTAGVTAWQAKQHYWQSQSFQEDQS